MTTKPPPTPEDLILAMLREVLARQAQQMGLSAPPAPVAPDRPPAATAIPTPPPASPAPVPAAQPPAPAPRQAAPATAEAAKPDTARSVEPIFQPLPDERPGPTGPATSRQRASAGHARERHALSPEEAPEDTLTPAELRSLAELNEIAMRPYAPSGMVSALRWILLGLAALVLVVNLPLPGGLAIVRATPAEPALILYEGLLLKGSGAAVYVIEHGAKRLLSSEDAFLQRGYRWSQVRVIGDDTLREIAVGQPIHVLVQCPGNPNRYLLEGDQKRFIADWAAAEALGYTEADLRTISCSRLRSFSDGATIP